MTSNGLLYVLFGVVLCNFPGYYEQTNSKVIRLLEEKEFFFHVKSDDRLEDILEFLVNQCKHVREWPIK